MVASAMDEVVLSVWCDHPTSDKIDAFFRKWLRRLPRPLSATDRRAGYRYTQSMLQVQFSLNPGVGPAHTWPSILRRSDPRKH